MEPEFELGQKVRFKTSKEEGEVIGKAYYLHSPTRYLVSYKDAVGVHHETWTFQGELEAA